jgi:hypothetical protein
MNRDSNQRLAWNERREWIRPLVRSISAGSAELNVATSPDGPDDS